MGKQISNSDLDMVVSKALGKLGKAAKTGDSTAAQEIIKELIRSQLELAASNEHRDRMREIGSDTIKLCTYLGELGAPDSMVKRSLGNRQMNAEERKAFTRGSDDRVLEARALELGHARRGGKVLEWMTRIAS